MTAATRGREPKALSPSKRKAPEAASANRKITDAYRATKPVEGAQQAPPAAKGLSNELHTLLTPSAKVTQLQQVATGEQRVTRRASGLAALPPRSTRAAASPDAKPAVAATPARKGGRKQQQRGGAATRKPSGGADKRTHVAEVTLDGETFKVGDVVYVVLDEAQLGQLSDAAEEEEECACMVCGSTDVEEQPMLECDRCLEGCHLGCVDPPLNEVPDGEWVCASCTAGNPPPVRHAATARERLLQRQGLGLARLEALWQRGDDAECSLRWFCIPEETHTGRQHHHAAREVFLTQLRDVEGMEVVLRRAHALLPAEFRRSSALGEDVFMCEYEYDMTWQRFRRRTEFGSDSEDEWAAEEGDQSSDDEGHDRLFRPLDEMGQRQGINRRGKTQGGDDFLRQVGALAIPEHVRQPRAGAGSALSAARDVLTLTAVPRSLPCRDAERQQVVDFVTEVLADAEETASGRCLYVSGIPGTGKTATVLEVMRGLRRRAEAGELPAFQFVEINGLRLPSPQHAYSTLYEALTGDRAGPRTAVEALDQMFGGGGTAGGGSKRAAPRRPTIVLVDEMDLLVNKAQTVLYNLFDWPGRRGSRLSIIGVANTMDLPERLHPRIGSRLAGRRVVFHPYSREQLETIVRARLEGSAAFAPSAVTFIARKVANCSGDVRRCLELCRRAAEIAEERLLVQQEGAERPGAAVAAEGSPGQQQQQAAAGEPSSRPAERGVVEMRHVDAAIREMLSTSHARMVREACRLERLLLAALHLESKYSGRAECLLEDVADRLRTLCAQNGQQQYDFGALLESAVELGAKRLVIADPGAKRLKAKLALNVPTSDLISVLSADAELPWLAHLL